MSIILEVNESRVSNAGQGKQGEVKKHKETHQEIKINLNFLKVLFPILILNLQNRKQMIQLSIKLII